jgi:hypothetical protein
MGLLYLYLYLSQLNPLLPLSSLFTIRFNIIILTGTNILIAVFQIKIACEFIKLIYYESVLQNVELMLLTLPCDPPPARKNNSVLMNGDSKSRSEIPAKFEMWYCRRTGKIIWADCVRNEEVLQGIKEEMNILHTIKIRKANWIGHILCRNCLLKHVTERKIERTARRGRRHKQQQLG